MGSGPSAQAARAQAGRRRHEQAGTSFWTRLLAARDKHTFQQVWREPFALRLAGGKTTYKPDFMTLDSLHRLYLWEVKGFMRDDAAVKLKLAASLYNCFAWVLVQKDRGRMALHRRDLARLRTRVLHARVALLGRTA